MAELILTRPRLQAGEWLRRLAELGVAAQSLPLIEIEGADGAEAAQAWRELPGAALAMFVSPNAVEHFFRHRPTAQSWPGDTLAACVGPGSAAALREAGVPEALIVQPPPDAASLDSEHLWPELESRRDWTDRRVMLLRGEGGRDWLAERLRERGALTSYFSVYRRRCPVLSAGEQGLLAKALAAPQSHAWLFSSAEAVGHLRSLAPAGQSWSAARAICTHERIAEAARALGVGHVVLARPDAAAVAAAFRGLQDSDLQSFHCERYPGNPHSRAAGQALPAWLPVAALVVGVAAVGAIGLSWQSLTRQQSLEQELVRRQDQSRSDAAEARASARAAQDLTRDTAAKVALLDVRLAEVALQRGQLEELIQSMSRSRDENVVIDIEAAVRVAIQQTAITGSAEPLVAALRQADERLLRYKQPRLEGVRRAVARDLDRVKAVSVVDVSTLTIKLDELVRLLDELPMLAGADREMRSTAPPVPAAKAPAAKPPAKPASAAQEQGLMAAWWSQARERWDEGLKRVWGETRSLVRVTRIDHPEAMLIAPEQSFFLRENLKLRLLNARLALLSRQFDTAQADLRDTQEMLDRYFDGRSRKVVAAGELLKQVGGQAKQVNVPRPDDTLAALAAAVAGR